MFFEGALNQAVDVNTRQMNLIRVELTDLYDFFYEEPDIFDNIAA